ncbi:DUF47 family protein [archaeon]|nr:DUF47 family protein [archaeon]
MSSFTRWFASRTRERIYELTRRHMEQVRIAVNELPQLVDAAFRGDESAVMERFTRISLAEDRADEIRREADRVVAGSEILPADRGDLISLFDKVDLVVDRCQGAARVLRIIIEEFGDDFEKLSENIRDKILRMLEADRNCVEHLHQAIDALLRGEVGAAMEAADHTESLEKRVDEQYRETERAIIRERAANPIFVLYLMRFVDILEQIADGAEDASDQVRILAAQMR